MDLVITKIGEAEFNFKFDQDAMDCLAFLRKKAEPEVAPATEEYELRQLMLGQMRYREKWIENGRMRKHPVREKMISILDGEGPTSVKDLRKKLFFLTAATFRQSLTWAEQAKAITILNGVCRLGPNWNPKPKTQDRRGEAMVKENIDAGRESRESIMLFILGSGASGAKAISEGTQLRKRTVQYHLRILVSERKLKAIGKGRTTVYCTPDQAKDTEELDMRCDTDDSE